ncbi:MAG: FGGY-family carbohydrate kinase [Henriciella sp.]
MRREPNYIAVFDIGKTNVKLHLLDREFNSLSVDSIKNTVVEADPYPHFDTDRIWNWLIKTLRTFNDTFPIDAINISAHGAAAALINANASPGADGLVLPILDYEHIGPESLHSEYDQLRPPFEESRSPKLPMGLNLGAQLYWQETSFAASFQEATHILPYPQYWAWRLSGILCSEVTSLGCHTDLWCPEEGSWSSLAKDRVWERLFPPLVSARSPIGSISAELADETGIDPSCEIYPGVHDSNASFARYISRDGQAPFSVISSGTWAIAMASGTTLKTLNAERDMLANVDVNGDPIACARSMGGREFGAICDRMDADTDSPVSDEDILQVLHKRVLAIPDFSGGSGPFGGHKGQILNDCSDLNGAALATVYAALMIDFKLDLLDVRGDVFVEGPFADNSALCGLLAQLRPAQRVFASTDITGTVVGCAQLTLGIDQDPVAQSERVEPRDVSGLNAYRNHWRKALPTKGALETVSTADD